MEGEHGVIRSIVDELYFSDIQGVQREGESGVTGDIQRDQIERDSGGTRLIID